MRHLRKFILLLIVFGSALNFGAVLADEAETVAQIAPDGVQNETYFAPFPLAIALDGEIGDWAGVPWVEMTRPFSTVVIRFAAAADEEFLYFVADVTDDSIVAGQHNNDYWNEDSVELYLNGTGDLTLRTYQDGVAQVTLPAVNIGAAPEDVVVAGVRGETVNATSVMVETEGGYLVEVAIPLVNDVWEIVPEHAGELGFNVHLNAAAKENRDTKMIWSRLDVSDSSYQTPNVFGRLIFFEIGKEEFVVADKTPEDEKPALDPSITWDSREWELLWSDEFDGEAGEAINPEYWTAEIGGHGWGNSEHQYYTDRLENVSLDGDGNLAITARMENPGDYNCHYGECRYTSARIVTMGKVEFTYGRVEARIKIPRGQGIWPAFWMLGADFGRVGWPTSGELDIMENIGKEPRTVHGTVHGPGYSGAQGIGGSRSFDDVLADDFHIYAVDWDADAIRWYIDGQMFFALTQTDLASRRWAFDHDFFIIMNVAVGGVWPGYPDATTEFPQTMLVDYVRVYQLAEK